MVAASAAAEPSAAENKPDSSDAAASVQQQPVAKRLDFESQEEFPPEESPPTSVSPSIIVNHQAKMRRKSVSGESSQSAGESRRVFSACTACCRGGTKCKFPEGSKRGSCADFCTACSVRLPHTHNLKRIANLPV